MSWDAKNLSYAGRLQLIQSLIYSLVDFWCTAVISPRKVIRAVEQKCNKAFLWKGGTESVPGCAKVKWLSVCLPKTRGGVGIKDLTVWNEASNLKLIWLLLSKARSLWIAWVTTHLLKGRSFWGHQCASLLILCMAEVIEV